MWCSHLVHWLLLPQTTIGFDTDVGLLGIHNQVYLHLHHHYKGIGNPKHEWEFACLGLILGLLDFGRLNLITTISNQVWRNCGGWGRSGGRGYLATKTRRILLRKWILKSRALWSAWWERSCNWGSWDQGLESKKWHSDIGCPKMRRKLKDHDCHCGNDHQWSDLIFWWVCLKTCRESKKWRLQGMGICSLTSGIGYIIQQKCLLEDVMLQVLVPMVWSPCLGYPRVKQHCDSASESVFSYSITYKICRSRGQPYAWASNCNCPNYLVRNSTHEQQWFLIWILEKVSSLLGCHM